jgi:hypothetical protein
MPRLYPSTCDARAALLMPPRLRVAHIEEYHFVSVLVPSEEGAGAARGCRFNRIT